jgi:nitrous oxide reductase accessory protein NosL
LDPTPPDSLSAAQALAAAEGGYVVEFDEQAGGLVNGRRVA